MFSTAGAVFSLLLVVTGVAKLVRPGDVEKALRALGIPAFGGAGRLIGGLEVVVGLAAVIWQPALVLQAVFYANFTIWVAVALRRDVPIASCGCLGRDDTPPTRAHVVLNVIAVITSIFAAMGEPLAFPSFAAGLAQVVVIATGLFLAYVVLSDGATLEGVRTR